MSDHRREVRRMSDGRRGEERRESNIGPQGGERRGVDRRFGERRLGERRTEF